MAATARDDDSPVVRSEESMKAVLLVGGLGTRLRSAVPSIPKALACVGSKSFLELLIQQLHSQGFNRLVMCTGYLADQIENQFGIGHDWAVTIEYSRETKSLGTAGAIKLAAQYLRECPDFLVMNGDSFMEIDLHDLLRFHRAHGGLISIAVVEVEDASRYGTVRLNSGNKVTRFLEKTGEHVVNRSRPNLVTLGSWMKAVAHDVLGNRTIGRQEFRADVLVENMLPVMER